MKKSFSWLPIEMYTTFQKLDQYPRNKALCNSYKIIQWKFNISVEIKSSA